jgi:hypothetical protein
MTHLEALISEYLEWRGFLIRRNTKVGPLAHGGWEMELDVVGFHPQSKELVHYEPSIDALSWDKREATVQKEIRGRSKIHIQRPIRLAACAYTTAAVCCVHQSPQRPGYNRGRPHSVRRCVPFLSAGFAQLSILPPSGSVASTDIALSADPADAPTAARTDAYVQESAIRPKAATCHPATFMSYLRYCSATRIKRLRRQQPTFTSMSAQCPNSTERGIDAAPRHSRHCGTSSPPRIV